MAENAAHRVIVVIAMFAVIDSVQHHLAYVRHSSGDCVRPVLTTPHDLPTSQGGDDPFKILFAAGGIHRNSQA